MIIRTLMMCIIYISTLSICFADEAPSPEEEACMGREDQELCRYFDYSDESRSGNCLRQVCIAHCPASAAEGSECTVIYREGESISGICDEGICNTSEMTGGMEAAGGEANGGEANGGQSLSDFLGNAGSNNPNASSEENRENAGEDSETEGCQQGSSAFTMAPFWLSCVLALGFIRRRIAQ
ncbi:MAG: hypothetical protein CMH49_01795 [Myxococcales bacterium]|nr:hypothetical protein [Myxococcales bacterium]